GLPRLPVALQGTQELGLAPGAVAYLALELATGRVDVVAAGTPDHGQHLRVEQDLLERADLGLVRALVAGARERIERNQVDLARITRLDGVVELAHQPGQLARMLG